MNKFPPVTIPPSFCFVFLAYMWESYIKLKLKLTVLDLTI